jgi:integrase
MSELLLDRAGRRRSPATLPGFHAGQAPGNKGVRYPADPPKVEEIVGVMRSAGDDAHGRRLRGLIVVMWRAGLRVREALALTEGDLDQRRGSLLIRRGKGGRRREVGMDAWGWKLQPWLEIRRELPVGPVLCVINVCSSLTLTRPQYQPSYRRDIAGTTGRGVDSLAARCTWSSGYGDQRHRPSPRVTRTRSDGRGRICPCRP